MANFLALDTSTDACTVALLIDGCLAECHEVIPKQHSQRLFEMLADIVPNGQLREQGIDAVVYGSGPGSFTGLRIGASAVQGICYANNLSAIAINTLEIQAWTALAEGLVSEGDIVVSTIDAQIGELYWGLYRVEGEHIQMYESVHVGKPDDFQTAIANTDRFERIIAIGSGLNCLRQLSTVFSKNFTAVYSELLPRASAMFKPALKQWKQGKYQSADKVSPVYVRDEISWKKLSEQAKGT
ncbi:MAG: tRNA (adenosine(37)-N6)-threonylcarbamoyltransferase complex dimerization subunit type 1 TsaB [Parahaliea sp.]